MRGPRQGARAPRWPPTPRAARRRPGAGGARRPGARRALRHHRADSLGKSASPAHLSSDRHASRPLASILGAAGRGKRVTSRQTGQRYKSPDLRFLGCARTPGPPTTPGSRGLQAPERCASRRSRTSVTAAISWSDRNEPDIGCRPGGQAGVRVPAPVPRKPQLSQ
jgi:hypothetical protein